MTGLTRKTLEKKAAKLTAKKDKLGQQLDAVIRRGKKLEADRHKLGNQIACVNEIIKNLDELEKE